LRPLAFLLAGAAMVAVAGCGDDGPKPAEKPTSLSIFRRAPAVGDALPGRPDVNARRLGRLDGTVLYVTRDANHDQYCQFLLDRGETTPSQIGCAGLAGHLGPTVFSSGHGDEGQYITAKLLPDGYTTATVVAGPDVEPRVVPNAVLVLRQRVDTVRIRLTGPDVPARELTLADQPD